MDSSRRAVESYWRSRMIDGATSDEDKVTPVYKLEEICEMLRSSHVSIVKEISEFILKRLDHKSPIVKQKALRLVKYAVGKSGVEFRREMQRHSAAVRQLLHYKGQLDPLKGDSLNKAVRDTAQEALSALFASEDNKPAPTEELSRRIEGFGNTNSEMPSEDKKSFLSEVVGLGSASIKQGLSSISAAHSLRNNGSGSYKGPNLRSSLTKEIENPDRYERVEHYRETQGSSGIPKDVAGGPWNRDSRVNMLDTANADSSSSNTKNKSREERLVETIVTSGGVRLQPTRDAIQVFLVEASKLDTIELSHALESKLQSHLWQVRMKAVCVLESILRKKDDAHFSTVASYFSENKDAVVRCSESPQASLSEKANKVLGLLDGEHTTGARSHSQKTTAVKSETDTIVMPDLIDTGEPYDYDGKDDSTHTQNGQGSTNLMSPSAPAVIDDLFGDSLITGVSTTTHNNEEDPFADVSFHTKMDREQTDDLFSGLTIDDKHPIEEYHMPVNKVGEEVFDIFGPSSELLHNQDMNDLMAGLSINENASPLPQTGSISGTLSESIFADQKPSHRVSNDALNGIIGSQIFGTGPNTMPPSSSMQYSIPPNIIFNPAFASQNYPPMGNFIAQQQLLATMSNFQKFGNINTRGNAGFEYAAGQSKEGGYSSPFPDIFNPHIPSQPQSTILNSSKKEETKAFDFISEHLSAARDPKRVV